MPQRLPSRSSKKRPSWQRSLKHKNLSRINCWWYASTAAELQILQLKLVALQSEADEAVTAASTKKLNAQKVVEGQLEQTDSQKEPTEHWKRARKQRMAIPRLKMG